MMFGLVEMSVTVAGGAAALVVLVDHRWGRQRSWVRVTSLLTAAGCLALGVAVACLRDGAVAAAVPTTAKDQWASLLAMGHADAMQAGFVAAAVAALLFAVDASVSVAAADQEPPSNTGVPFIAVVFAACILWLPAAGAAAVPVWLAALALRRAGSVRVCSMAAFALVCAALALAAITEDGLYRALAYRGTDGVEVAAGMRALGFVMLFVTVGVAARLAPNAVVGVGILAVAGGIAAERRAFGQVRSFGPPEGLAAVQDVPLRPSAKVARPPSGCLLRPDGALFSGTPLGPYPGDCPAVPMPGDFDDRSEPWFAVPERFSSDALAGWHASGDGSVRVVVRLDEGRGFQAWRRSLVRFRTVYAESPSSAPANTLPGAVLVHQEDGSLVVADVGGVRPIHGDVTVAVVAALAGQPRAEVWLHVSAVPTVGSLVDHCQAVQAHRNGVVCVLAVGPVAFFEGLVGRRPQVPVEGGAFEVEVVDELPDSFP